MISYFSTDIASLFVWANRRCTGFPQILVGIELRWTPKFKPVVKVEPAP